MKLALACCRSLAEKCQTLVTLDFGTEEVGVIKCFWMAYCTKLFGGV